MRNNNKKIKNKKKNNNDDNRRRRKEKKEKFCHFCNKHVSQPKDHEKTRTHIKNKYEKIKDNEKYTEDEKKKTYFSLNNHTFCCNEEKCNFKTHHFPNYYQHCKKKHKTIITVEQRNLKEKEYNEKLQQFLSNNKQEADNINKIHVEVEQIDEALLGKRRRKYNDNRNQRKQAKKYKKQSIEIELVIEESEYEKQQRERIEEITNREKYLIERQTMCVEEINLKMKKLNELEQLRKEEAKERKKQEEKFEKIRKERFLEIKRRQELVEQKKEHQRKINDVWNYLRTSDNLMSILKNPNSLYEINGNFYTKPYIYNMFNPNFIKKIEYTERDINNNKINYKKCVGIQLPELVNSQLDIFVCCCENAYGTEEYVREHGKECTVHKLRCALDERKKNIQKLRKKINKEKKRFHSMQI